jgi:hypothetical protein
MLDVERSLLPRGQHVVEAALLVLQVARVPFELHDPPAGEHVLLLALPRNRGDRVPLDHANGDGVGGEEDALFEGLDAGAATLHVGFLRRVRVRSRRRWRQLSGMGETARWRHYITKLPQK